MLSKVSKMRKVDSESRSFKEIWTDMYFFVEYNSYPVCLICQEKVSVLKEYNLRRHYDTKHGDIYSTLQGQSRKDKIEDLKKNLSKQQNVFKTITHQSVSAVEASYAVSHMIAKAMKPFAEGDFVKDCLLKAAEIVCPDKKQYFANVSLSRNTVAQRVTEMADDLTAQLREKAKTFQFFSIAADESTDNTDTAQVMFLLRGVDDHLIVTEELAQVVALHDTTRGQDIFKAFSEMLTNLSLPLEKLAGVTTDGAPSMIGNRSGFVSLVKAKQREINSPIELISFHCIIHQQALCSQIANLENVMSVVVKTVNFIKSRGLNHRQFQSLMTELEAEYTDVIYHSEVRWLSRGNVLKRFYDLRQEIETFMVHKNNEVPELADSDWITDLAFLVDITAHLNALNCKLQGKDIFISEAFDMIRAFETKLQLWISQLEQGRCEHFQHLNEAKNTAEALNIVFDSSKFSRKVADIHDSFGKRFSAFREVEDQLQLFSNPFAINPETVPNFLQMELIDLQCNTALKTKFTSTEVKAFYQQLPRESFSHLRKHAARMLCLFASTYLCEQAFSKMTLVKTKLRSRLTDANLHANLRVALAVDMQPDIPSLVKRKQCQVSGATNIFP